VTAANATRRLDPATFALGSALLVVSAWSWLEVWRGAHAMQGMSGMTPAASAPAVFVLEWGVMMAAMMLPSASPAILLYGTVRRRLAAGGEKAVPAPVFAMTYLLLWTLLGIPVYAASVLASSLGADTPRALPYGVAAVLAIAGLYQLTPFKHRCLAACDSPLSFFMTRWRSGYVATAGLAARHALYCVGCCWALMVVLVAAGAMGIWWVTAIALVVFLEKCVPHGRLTARLVGITLLLLSAAVLGHPGLAAIFRARVG
jgi:predicted metal-binding membrane protein